MRFHEILQEYHFDPIPENMTQKAESMGFDTSKIWFHGSNNEFAQFQLVDRKDAYNELGKGIYLTGDWSTAIAFGDIIYDCYIKKGPIYDKNQRPTDEQMQKMYEIYVARGNVSDRYKEFKPFHYDMGINYNSMVTGYMIQGLGYIGAIDGYSQISDQVIIYDPANVFVGSVNPRGEWGDRR